MMPNNAPKNSTSANRIRERYLHQLGLQRGAIGGVGDPLSSSQHYRAMLAQQNHVVLITGLPSLPEDRPSNPATVMESHDHSTSRHTHHSITTLGSEILISDEFSYDDGTAAGDDRTDDSTARDVVMDTTTTTHHIPLHKTMSRSTKNQHHCQQQQKTPSAQCNESLLHKALAFPPGGVHLFQPNNKSSTTPNPLSHPPALSFPWQKGNLVVACNTLLDLTDGGDSVKSECTSTTAESSYLRDHWGGCGMSTTTTTTLGRKQPGVVGGGGAGRNSSNTYCPTSSLTTELHGFNIDSDCEASSVATLASIATTSTTHRSEGRTSSPLSTADGDTTATTNTITSHQSSKSSSRSAKSSSSVSSRKKKLLLRATAHERILKIRSDQSSKMRADVIHSQRGDSADTDGSKTRQQQHLQAGASQDVMSRTPPTIPGQLSYIDHGLGRTPVASNCSDVLSNLRKLREIEKNYKHLFPYSSLWGNNNSSCGVGEGVHIALPSPPCLTTGATAPSGIYTSSLLPPNRSTTGILHNSRPNPQLTSTSPKSTIETNSNTAVPWSIDPILFALQHKNHTTNLSRSPKNKSSTRNYHHERTPSVDEDLLQVALSLAGMKRSG